MNHTVALTQTQSSDDIAIKTSRILILIKMLLVIPFGVAVSSLVLYMTHQLHLPDAASIGVTASFIGCTGIMRVIAGLMGDRFFSHCDLLILCALFLIIGCFLIIDPTYFYYGVTSIAAGSGLLIAVNCLITDVFQADDMKREAAFIRNYSGMNAGYIISFAMSGYYELHQQYQTLFMLASVFSLAALSIIVHNWRILSSYQLIKPTHHNKSYQVMTGLVLLLATLFCMHELIQTAAMNNTFIFIFSILFVLWIIQFAMKQPTSEKKNKIFSYLILAAPVLVYWTMFNLSPMALTLFVERSVNRHFLGIEIAPQWVQLINTSAVILVGPLLCHLFNSLRKRGININPSHQFSVGLILIGLALLILPLGIYFSNPGNLVNFNWIIASFTLQGISELLIAPIGFAMIAKLVPHQSQGIMMGNWMMLISTGAIISGYLSKLLLSDYSTSFCLLGGFSVFTGITAYIILPLILNKLLLQP